MGSDCSVMVYQVSAWKNNQSGCLGDLPYLSGANKHLHHKMQVMSKKSGDLCKFCFGGAGLVRVSSLGKCHQGTRANQPGLQRSAASMAWLCFSSWHREVTFGWFLSRLSTLWSPPTIWLLCLVGVELLGRGRLQVPSIRCVWSPWHHRAEPGEHLQAAAPRAIVPINSKNNKLK